MMMICSQYLKLNSGLCRFMYEMKRVCVKFNKTTTTTRDPEQIQQTGPMKQVVVLLVGRIIQEIWGEGGGMIDDGWMKEEVRNDGGGGYSETGKVGQWSPAMFFLWSVTNLVLQLSRGPRCKIPFPHFVSF